MKNFNIDRLIPSTSTIVHQEVIEGRIVVITSDEQLQQKMNFAQMLFPAKFLVNTDYNNQGTITDDDTVVALYLNQPLLWFKNGNRAPKFQYMRFNVRTGESYSRYDVSEKDIGRLSKETEILTSFVRKYLEKR